MFNGSNSEIGGDGAGVAVTGAKESFDAKLRRQKKDEKLVN
jgi:hypothetical protein